MKRTLKKLTAFTLVFMLLFSLSAVPVSAASIFDKIASVEVTGEPTVTAREIDEYIEYMSEYGWDDEDDYLYPVNTVFEVALTSGEVIVTEDYGYGENADGKRWIIADAYIDIRDYQQAKESGSDALPLIYEVYLYSSIAVEMDYLEGESEAKLIDCYVKSITPVSGLSDSYYDRGYIYILIDEYLPVEEEFDLEGAVFDITYPDGSVVRDTVKTVVDEDDYEYYELNGEEIWYNFYHDEQMVEIYYYDFCYEHPVEYIPFPVSEIVIDEVVVNDDFEAESVSYTVTKADGTTQSYTYTFDGEPTVSFAGVGGYLAESVDGAYIVIGSSSYYTDDYPSTEVLEVAVFADIDVYAIENIEGETQEDNLLNRLIYKIRMLIMRILEILWYFY